MRLFLALLACAGLAACSPAPKSEPTQQATDVGDLTYISGVWGVSFWVDPLTGCHYLRAPGTNASLTPRMQADGRQVCEAPQVRP